MSDEQLRTVTTGAMRLALQPVTLKEAAAWVRQHHRHHGPDRGGLFAVAAGDGARVLGVVVIGRPKARMLQDGYTCEVTRCCVLPDLPPRLDAYGKEHPLHVASLLYGAAWRAARALGYRRLVTYTLRDETGTSLVAAGWKQIAETQEGRKFRSRGGPWSRLSRPRVDTYPQQEKLRWETTDV
jgi:hypothetical protein